MRFAILSKRTRVTGQVLTIDSGQRFMGLERDVQFLGDAMSAAEPKLDGLVPDAPQGPLGAHPARSARGPGGHRLSRFRGRGAAAAAGHGRNLAGRCRRRRRTTIRRAPGTMTSCAPRSRRSPRRGATISRKLWPTQCSTRSPRSAACSAVRVRTSKPDVYPDAHGVGRRNRFLFRRLARTSERRAHANGGFTPSGMWNKIRCAAFEPEIRRRACCR